MSKPNKKVGFLSRGATTCKNIFWQATEDDISQKMPHDREDESDGLSEVSPHKESEMGDGAEMDNNNNDRQQIDAGKRSPRWFERMEAVTEENRKRSIQTRNLVERVDFRTVWIARLLIALLASILAALALQLYI